jgi:chaperonin cofactor prefoldin
MKDIHEQLRERYQAPEWAIFFEVANGPGSTLRRYADAIAMSLFPSRGLDIHGFEIKQVRGDWLNELKNPTKAETIASFCDYWWIVAGNEKVALKDEVPRNWGLLVSKDDALRQVKRAERLDPKPLDRKFVGALLRRADEWMKQQLKDDSRMIKAKEKGIEEGRELAELHRKYDQEDLKKIQARLKEFEKVSGVEIDNWHYGNVGEAVKAFLFAQKYESTEELEKTANLIEASAKTLRDRVELLKAARAKLDMEKTTC